MIAAISKNRALGKDNKLIWKIPEDFKRYVALTTGHAIIMGRKTYQSIGRPLPRRTNIIVTRDVNFQAPGCIICHNLDEALTQAKKIETSEIFINGGAEIYTQALPLADKLYLTLVDQDAQGDAFFPPYEDQFKKITFEQKGEFNGLRYRFLELERN